MIDWLLYLLLAFGLGVSAGPSPDQITSSAPPAAAVEQEVVRVIEGEGFRVDTVECVATPTERQPSRMTCLARPATVGVWKVTVTGTSIPDLRISFLYGRQRLHFSM